MLDCCVKSMNSVASSNPFLSRSTQWPAVSKLAEPIMTAVHDASLDASESDGTWSAAIARCCEMLSVKSSGAVRPPTTGKAVHVEDGSAPTSVDLAQEIPISAVKPNARLLAMRWTPATQVYEGGAPRRQALLDRILMPANNARIMGAMRGFGPRLNLARRERYHGARTRYEDVCAVVVAVFASMGCASHSPEHSAEMGDLFQCANGWFGNVQDPDRIIRVKQCLSDNLCTGEVEVDLDAPAPSCGTQPTADQPAGGCPPQVADSGGRCTVQDYLVPAAMKFEACMTPDADGSSDTALSFQLIYGPEVAARLNENDRATLVLHSETAQTITARSQAPYFILHGSSGETCKSLGLNLDGSARSTYFPYYADM